MSRREHLLETKYFLCECSRCEDPTEFGTHLSSLKCPHCHKGLISLNSKVNYWICNQCSHQYNKGLINATLHHIQNLIDDVDKNNIHDTKILLKKLTFTLSPNHSYLIDLKQQLAVIYREEKQTMEFLNERKKICEELLSVIQVLEPGISRFRGIALYELQSVLLGQSHLKQNDLSLMKNAEIILKEAVSLLLHEPPNSTEGGLARQALSELKSLREVLQRFEKNKTKKNINN